MKIFKIILLSLYFTGIVTSGYAQYSSQAYGGEKLTVFNRFSDWFATVGKPQKEKYRIKLQRRTARKIKKAKKRIARQKKNFSRK